MRFADANRSPLRLKTLWQKQSVDDSHAALEIARRSSYVPTFNHRRLIPVLPAMRAQRGARLHAWKSRYG
jgi:hypothetical protein